MICRKVDTSQFVLFQHPCCRLIWFQLYFLGLLCFLCKGGIDGKNRYFLQLPWPSSRNYCNYQRETVIFTLRYSKLVYIPIFINYIKSNTRAMRAGCCLQRRATVSNPFVSGVVLSLYRNSSCLTHGLRGQSHELPEAAECSPEEVQPLLQKAQHRCPDRL